jgi:hypothetical protein
MYRLYRPRNFSYSDTKLDISTLPYTNASPPRGTRPLCIKHLHGVEPNYHINRWRKYTLVKKKCLTRIFAAGDVISFFVQEGGKLRHRQSVQPLIRITGSQRQFRRRRPIFRYREFPQDGQVRYRHRALRANHLLWLLYGRRHPLLPRHEKSA